MSWKNDLSKNITKAEELKLYLQLSEEKTKKISQVTDKFSMSIPHYYLSLIDKSNEDDPIRRMCVPSGYEEDTCGSFDTSGETENTVISGLQHKYKQTALILSTNNCAMYCRHCFRKRLVGLDDDEIAKNIKPMTDYISSHEEISNVLITGGDSFMLSNTRIEDYLKALTKIDHLDFIRFGTRTPVVLPKRITKDDELIEILNRYCKIKQIFVVTQFNHKNEFTDESKKAIKKLINHNIPVLNQTVLLKGVNDSAESLADVFKELTVAGAIPYYLFQCRPVSGVKDRFQVPFMRAYEIVEGAKKLQNGIGKSFRYCMSHVTGKIEILGPEGDNMLFIYHEAKYDKDFNRIFSLKIDNDTCWIGDDEI